MLREARRSFDQTRRPAQDSRRSVDFFAPKVRLGELGDLYKPSSSCAAPGC